MKKLTLLYFVLLQLSTALGQSSISDFLSSYKNEEAVLFQKSKLNSLSIPLYKLPYIEKLEVRTETNEFDWRKQEYLFRVSPNSIRNIKTHRQYHSTVRYITEMELAAAENQAIRKRYDLIIDHIFLAKVLTVKQKKATLLKDKVTLLQRSVALPDFDIMDLIEAEDDLQKIIREIMDIENAILATKNTMQRITPHLEQFEEEGLLSVDNIKRTLNILKDTDVVHPVLEVQSGKVYNKILEHQWEEAKGKFSLGFIQAQYGYDTDDKFRKSLSIGIGFDIPFKNTGRMELNELKIDIHENESTFRELKSEISEGKFFQLQQLNNLIRKYDLVALQLKKGQSEYVLQEYQKIAETPPNAMVKLRENTIQIELLLQELEYKIIQSFIAYLDFAGLLNQEPFNNYLIRKE